MMGWIGLDWIGLDISRTTTTTRAPLAVLKTTEINVNCMHELNPNGIVHSNNGNWKYKMWILVFNCFPGWSWTEFPSPEFQFRDIKTVRSLIKLFDIRFGTFWIVLCQACQGFNRLSLMQSIPCLEICHLTNLNGLDINTIHWWN